MMFTASLMTDGWLGNSEIHTPWIAWQPSWPVHLFDTFLSVWEGCIGFFRSYFRFTNWEVGWENAWVFSKWRRYNDMNLYFWGSWIGGVQSRAKAQKFDRYVQVTLTACDKNGWAAGCFRFWIYENGRPRICPYYAGVSGNQSWRLFPFQYIILIKSLVCISYID